MTASEASRNFSHVLDSAERGDAIVITRGGRRVAAIIPAPQANGAALRAVLERWHAHPALDESFAAHVASAREAASPDMDSDAWRA